MRNIVHIIYLSILFFICVSCNESKNDKNAYIINRGGEYVIKLTGHRLPLVHDIITYIFSTTVEDSLLINLPKNFKSGIIEGENIEVPEGNYKYKGYIEVKEKKIVVDLIIINTDYNKDIPESFNGEYKIIYK